MEKITGNDCNKKLSMKTNDDDKTMDDHGGQFYASSPTTGISLVSFGGNNQFFLFQFVIKDRNNDKNNDSNITNIIDNRFFLLPLIDHWLNIFLYTLSR